MKPSLVSIALAIALAPCLALADSSTNLANTMAHNPEVSSYQSSSLNPAKAAAYQDPNALSQQNTSTPQQVMDQGFSNVGDGPAIGVQVGRGSGIYRPQSETASGYDGNRYTSGGIAGVNASYGYTFSNKAYLGAQVNLNAQDLTGNTVDYSSNQIAFTYTFRQQYGLSLLSGYHFSPSDLFFIRTGLSSVKVDTNTTTIPASGSITNTGFSKTPIAWQLGLGYSAALTQDLALSLEYDYFYFPNTYTYNNVKYVFQEEAYMLGLTYQFDKMDPNNTTGQAHLNLNGPYIGTNLGRSSLNYSFSQFADSGSIQNESMRGTGYFDNLHLGYGWDMNSWFYLGTQAFSDLTNTKVSVGSGDDILANEKESYGLSIMPGYILNNSNLFFMSLGPIWTQFKGNDVSNTAGWAIVYNNTLPGFQFGLGYETALTTNLSMLFEYDYDVYQRLRVRYQGANYSLSLNQDLFSLGLNYRF